MWLEETLLPVLAPQVIAFVKGGEVHHIVPVADGIMVAVEKPDGSLVRMKFRASAAGWERLGEEAAKPDTVE
jgi:hypothetical protein